MNHLVLMGRITCKGGRYGLSCDATGACTVRVTARIERGGGVDVEPEIVEGPPGWTYDKSLYQEGYQCPECTKAGAL